MPFRSKAQARFMFAKHPAIAKRWVREAKSKGRKHPIRNLPLKVNQRSRKKKRRR